MSMSGLDPEEDIIKKLRHVIQTVCFFFQILSEIILRDNRFVYLLLDVNPLLILWICVKLPWALLLDVSDLGVARVLVSCHNATTLFVSIFQDESSGKMSIFQDGGGKAALRGTFWND